MSKQGGIAVVLCGFLGMVALITIAEHMYMPDFWNSLPKSEASIQALPAPSIVHGEHGTTHEYRPQTVVGGDPEWLCRVTDAGYERHPDLRQESCGEYRAHIRRWINAYFAVPLSQFDCWCADPCAKEMPEEYPCGPGQSF